MSPGDIHERIEAISRQEHNELIRFIRQYTQSSFIAEEVLQEAYLEAMKQADQIRQPDKLLSWLKTVAKRIAMEQIGKYNRLIRKCRRTLVYVHSTWEDDLLERIVISELLDEVLRNSPPYYRRVICCRYTYRMTYTQIAEELGISASAARQANLRVIRKIRKCLIYYKNLQ